jgi:MFS family permease
MKAMPIADDSPLGAAAPKLWKAGTLVYTTAGLAFLFCWLLIGDFGWQLKERTLMASPQLFLKKFAASDFFVGLLVGSIPSALGMILGPLISVRSDRHRGRWGRRIPILLIPLPFVVVSMAGLALSPFFGVLLHHWLGPVSPGLNGCVLGSFAVFWCVFEIFSTITKPVFDGLINDVVPQAVIGRFFGMFRMVSLLDGIIFNTFIIKHVEAHFSLVFIGSGLFYGIGFTAMCLMVKEGEYPPPEPLDKISSPGRFQSLRSYFRDCYTTPFYLWLFAAVILCTLSYVPVNSFSIFYAKSLGMSMELYGRFLASSYVVSLALAYFLGSLADRFHPLRMMIVSMFLYVSVTVFGALLGTNARYFGFAFLAHTIISGIYYTSMSSIGQRLYPRLKFAQFASAAFLMQGVLGALVPPGMGLILDASRHNYRLTFVSSGVLATLGLAGLLVVHRQFIQLGGPKSYVPPHTSPVLIDSTNPPATPA